MTYRLLAELVVAVHFAFVAYAIFGGLLALRWRWTALLHLPAVLWALWITWAGAICPLTPLENHLRRLAGDEGYPGGFLERYLFPVLYPSGLTRTVQALLGVGLAVLNLAVYGAIVWRLHRRRGPS